jgi:hypothetical protein
LLRSDSRPGLTWWMTSDWWIMRAEASPTHSSSGGVADLMAGSWLTMVSPPCCLTRCLQVLLRLEGYALGGSQDS